MCDETTTPKKSNRKLHILIACIYGFLLCIIARSALEIPESGIELLATLALTLTAGFFCIEYSKHKGKPLHLNASWILILVWPLAILACLIRARGIRGLGIFAVHFLVIIILSVVILLIAQPSLLDTAGAQVDRPKIKEYFAIEYTHQTGNVLYKGTLNLIDEKTNTEWTLSQNGSEQTSKLKMTRGQFCNIWAQTQSIPDFREHAVTPETQLNTETHHIIKIATKNEGKTDKRTYSIPKNSCSPMFKKWLSGIGYPGK